MVCSLSFLLRLTICGVVPAAKRSGTAQHGAGVGEIFSLIMNHFRCSSRVSVWLEPVYAQY